MAYPITTLPYVDYHGGTPPGATFLEQRQRTKQAKPYDLPTAYFRNSRYYGPVALTGVRQDPNYAPRAYTSAGDEDTYPMWALGPRASGFITDPMNKARARFVSDLGDNAQMAANLAEGQQALNLIALSVQRVGRAYSLLKRGKVLSAARALGITTDDARVRRYAGTARRRVSRKASSIFLEWHFGWIPIATDIASAINFLSNQQMSGHARGRSSTRTNWVFKKTAGTPENPSYLRGEHSTYVRCEVGADWEVINPNLFLANRLGFVNPLSVVWEVTPFSWVIDWFTNVSQFLGQFGEFYGVAVTNAYNTYVIEDSVNSSSHEYYPADTLYRGVAFSGVSVITERKLGIPAVRLTMLPAKRLSVTRGLTAIAVLIQLGIARSK